MNVTPVWIQWKRQWRQSICSDITGDVQSCVFYSERIATDVSSGLVHCTAVKMQPWPLTNDKLANTHSDMRLSAPPACVSTSVRIYCCSTQTPNTTVCDQVLLAENKNRWLEKSVSMLLHFSEISCCRKMWVLISSISVKSINTLKTSPCTWSTFYTVLTDQLPFIKMAIKDWLSEMAIFIFVWFLS